MILAIDPGGRETGLVLRDADELLAHLVIERKDKGKLPGPDYLELVIGAARAMAFRHGPHRTAVEAVNVPTGFSRGRKHFISFEGVMGCSMVLGAVLAHYPAAIVVPPGGNGEGPRQAYPGALWGEREGPAGAGRLRHARSAWDIAGAALKLADIEERSLPCS